MVILDEETGRVVKFVEKPVKFVGNKINAGIYLLNTSVLDRIPLQPTSLEHQIFPSIANEGGLYAMVSDNFWMDIGQPKDYLTGLSLYLEHIKRKTPELLATGPNIIGNVLIDKSAQIGEGCLIGPDVAVGPDCVIEPGVRLSCCTLMKGVRVKSSAHVSGSIVGRHSTIGQSALVRSMAVLGEDVHVSDTMYLNGVVVLPHKEIKSHFVKPEVVM